MSFGLTLSRAKPFYHLKLFTQGASIRSRVTRSSQKYISRTISDPSLFPRVKESFWGEDPLAHHLYTDRIRRETYGSRPIRTITISRDFVVIGFTTAIRAHLGFKFTNPERSTTLRVARATLLYVMK
jgi:hypothetical protein